MPPRKGKINLKAAAAVQLATQCRSIYLPEPTHYAGGPNKELMFHHTPGNIAAGKARDWRFDVAWTALQRRTRDPQLTVPGPKLALEIDGGVFLWRPCPRCKGAPGQRCPICRGAGQVQGGRHNTGAGYRDDVEKLAEATILGWYVFRCLPEQIKAGEVLTWLERFFYAHHVLLPPAPRPRRSYPNDTPQTETRETERPDPIPSRPVSREYLDATRRGIARGPDDVTDKQPR